MDSGTLRIGRDRLLRVFRYLQALNQHRNPVIRQIREQPWTLWLRDLPDHSSIRRGIALSESRRTLKRDENVQAMDRPAEEEFVLKVGRPTLTRSPSPPDEIEPWLEEGWNSPSKEVSVRATPSKTHEHKEARVVRFEEDPNRVSAFERWKLIREEWAKNERPARAAMKVFETLYELYGRIEREAERVELVIGNGILRWRRKEGDIFHPVLIQSVQLEFNPNVPEFTISETEHPVELYAALFQSLADIDGRAMGRCREELEQGNYHPLGDESTCGFLRRLGVVLSPHGQFVGSGTPADEKDYPQIGLDPVLFLRTRTLGFAAAIEGILADLRNRKDLPWSLLNIAGVEPPLRSESEIEATPEEIREEVEEILLSKPANPEQMRIARQLEVYGGVLVQGPPGTGKTHTIGNLIGHLLAQGKSVLVTSHTTKALRMVRQHVVDDLKALCVSVLESDLESRRQLESAVGAIAERLSRADAALLKDEADRLQRQRHHLLEKLRALRARLRDARADEYRDIVIGGQAWPPAEAARKVAREEKTHPWIPGPVEAGATVPLSEGEVTELYRTNVSLSAEDEFELSGQLPALDDLLKPADFEELIHERQRLSKQDLQLRSDLWNGAPAGVSAESVEAVSVKVRQAVEPLTGKDQWKLAAIYAGKHGGEHREPWERLVAFAQLVHREAARNQEAMMRHGPALAGEIDLEEQERVSGEILTHLEKGGRLNFFSLLGHGSWKQFIGEARVNGKPPRLAEHFNALRKLSHVSIQRRDLAAWWDRQMSPLGAVPSGRMGVELEKTIIQYCEQIGDCLAWHEKTWTPIETELQGIGFMWEKFLAEQPAVAGANGELLRLAKAATNPLPAILASRANWLKLLGIEETLRQLKSKLETTERGFAGSKVIGQLRMAASIFDSKGYSEGYERLLDLQRRYSDLERRRELLGRLEGVAPGWAAAIRAREGDHGQGRVPGDAGAAWIWRQLHDELVRRGSVSLEELQSEIEKLREQLRLVTVELIDRKAWAFQTKRTSLRQRQALVGWLDTIRKIGKGHGIRVPYLRAQAASKMGECRGAVPVWIMPLSRVVENFDPRTARFDVVIIDEASQSDVMALAALYLGRAVVVVGDHEQVSPAAVGQDVSVIQNLILQYLQGIPNAHLYDGQTSVYDLARQSFGGTICLVEHFRCVADIIQFSNHLSYDGRIKPLRDASRVKLKPHVFSYRVSGSTRDGKVNRQEAEIVASLVAAATEQPEYRTNEEGSPVSFGVVSLVGEEQALEVDRLLRKYLSPGQYERHRLLCGTAAQFQGDERDVVFISLVDTAREGPLPFRDQQMFKQRFNVAASRARNQMWVVHSLDPQNDLKPGDLRRRLIEHADDPSSLSRLIEQKEKRTQSVFEREVMRRLVTSGYRVTPQWRVGSFLIDLVVEGGDRRLAIECDGDRYHPTEKLAEDMERQAILERLGWVFARIRGSVFFRDPDQAMRPVYAKLQRLEIPCEGEVSRPGPHQNPWEELKDRIVRRADEVRRKWSEPNGDSRDSVDPQGPFDTIRLN